MALKQQLEYASKRISDAREVLKLVSSADSDLSQAKLVEIEEELCQLSTGIRLEAAYMRVYNDILQKILGFFEDYGSLLRDTELVPSLSPAHREAVTTCREHTDERIKFLGDFQAHLRENETRRLRESRMSLTERLASMPWNRLTTKQS